MPSDDFLINDLLQAIGVAWEDYKRSPSGSDIEKKSMVKWADSMTALVSLAPEKAADKAWEVYKDSPSGSKIEKKSIVIWADSMTALVPLAPEKVADKVWKTYKDSPSGSEIEKRSIVIWSNAMTALVSRTPDKIADKAWEVYKASPSGSKMERASIVVWTDAMAALIKTDTEQAIKKAQLVYKNCASGSKIELAAKKTLSTAQSYLDGIKRKAVIALNTALEQIAANICTSVDLSNHDLGTDGVLTLAKALKGNTTVTELNVKTAGLGDGGIQALADALKDSPNLLVAEGISRLKERCEENRKAACALLDKISDDSAYLYLTAADIKALNFRRPAIAALVKANPDFSEQRRSEVLNAIAYVDQLPLLPVKDGQEAVEALLREAIAEQDAQPDKPDRSKREYIPLPRLA